MQELARRLAEPGQITTHQFSKVILPSLHSSLLGKGSESERANIHRNGSGHHRNKKARVVDESGKAACDVAKYLLGDLHEPASDGKSPPGVSPSNASPSENDGSAESSSNMDQENNPGEGVSVEEEPSLSFFFGSIPKALSI